MKEGKGFIGIHTAVAGFAYSNSVPNEPPWVSLCKPYHEMLNGIFDGHSA